jgi:hypothetical protein
MNGPHRAINPESNIVAIEAITNELPVQTPQA